MAHYTTSTELATSNSSNHRTDLIQDSFVIRALSTHFWDQKISYSDLKHKVKRPSNFNLVHVLLLVFAGVFHKKIFYRHVSSF